jgi:hypothetical protein
VCISASKALALAVDLAGRLAPDPEAMARGLTAGAGTVHAEALSVDVQLQHTVPGVGIAGPDLIRDIGAGIGVTRIGVTGIGVKGVQMAEPVQDLRQQSGHAGGGGQVHHDRHRPRPRR